MRDRSTIERHIPADGGVTIDDLTSAKAVLNLCGPRSRDVLSRLTDAPLGNADFPYMSARQLDLGYAPVLALRVTYLGELGYELHVPIEYALYLYEKLWAAGEPFGIANAGYRAVNSLRLEKHYLAWGSDITPDYNPFEAGLGFCVAPGKADVARPRRADARQGRAGRDRSSRGSPRRPKSMSTAAKSCWPAGACSDASRAAATAIRSGAISCAPMSPPPNPFIRRTRSK